MNFEPMSDEARTYIRFTIGLSLIGCQSTSTAVPLVATISMELVSPMVS